ncbi:MAG: HlyD family type I secretion periplasmic adaptor subunit, partial [Pseudomonadota bacterium]|nr:HlyD family type I secretion periplasmic adaptor subunit [Pseudomonadota bacterium]
IFCVVAIVWAVNAEVDEQVRAEGVIFTPSEVQFVQSRLPGSVVEIEARLGRVVARGDVLYRLEDEDVTANFADNEIALNAARAAEIRLSAEAEGRNTLRFPGALAKAAPEMVQKEMSLFATRADALAKRVSVLRENIATLERAIIEKEAEERISLQKAALVEEEIAILAPLVEGGHEPRAALIAARARHQQETGAAELARLAASARRADMIGKQREIDSAIANFRAAAAETLVEEQTKTAQLLARQDALRGKVRHAEVRAPLSGTVSAVHVKTVGAVVQAGTMLAEIVPSEAEYLVRAQINPQDIADVQPGQVARISLAAYDPSRYGVIMGVVRRVATNTTQPENAMPFYETIIAIPEVAFTKSPDEPVVTAGMPLQVDILGGKRTIMNYIMTPIQKSLATAFRET